MHPPEDINLPSSPRFESHEVSPNTTPRPSQIALSRPETTQRSVSLESMPLAMNCMSGQHPLRPYNRSPISNGDHSHSHSAMSSLTLPPMQRAHSSPGVDSTGHVTQPSFSSPRRPSSPQGYSTRKRSPLGSAMEESYSVIPIWSGLSIEPRIPENAELDIPATNLPFTSLSETEVAQSSPISSVHNTLPRPRRRPASPLHQSASVPSFTPHLYATAPSPTSKSASNSPRLTAQRYANEPYPSYSFSSTSSMPSTPTSLRSRSPSISSLETIEDLPDFEEAAMIEAEELAKRRTEAGEENEGLEMRRRSSLELRSTGFGGKEKRKRWSVCGAERRADFSLEPIEE